MPKTSDVVQIKVTLAGTAPAIWRRIVVPTSINFFDLHHIIQISMGWKNSHLFEFHVGDDRIGFIDEQFEESDEIADALKVQIDLLLGVDGGTCVYIYDFGDHWEHFLEVEKVESVTRIPLPACIGGELNCPPEDCGGIPGFRSILKILADKNHPEYREIKRWLGRGYDPSRFEIEKVNKELPRFKKYMKHWEK